MRFSDMKDERVFVVIADIIDPIANIASDETASALFKREKLPDGMTAKAFLLERARKSVPALLKGHKGDIITVLATIDGVSADDYRASLTLAKLMQDTAELLTDEAFGELFISAQSGTASVSAQENIVESEQ